MFGATKIVKLELNTLEIKQAKTKRRNDVLIAVGSLVAMSVHKRIELPFLDLMIRVDKYRNCLQHFTGNCQYYCYILMDHIYIIYIPSIFKRQKAYK